MDYVTHEDIDQFEYHMFLNDQLSEVVFHPIDSLSAVPITSATPIRFLQIKNLKTGGEEGRVITSAIGLS